LRICAPPLPDAFTVNAIVVLWAERTEVPVTVTVAAPVGGCCRAVNVSTEVALPFAGGVTGLTENPAVTLRWQAGSGQGGCRTETVLAGDDDGAGSVAALDYGHRAGDAPM